MHIHCCPILPSLTRPGRFLPNTKNQFRSVSSSPYGRTHVWKRRPPKLPAPVVPQFPQCVIRSDGSTFTHWTTSPRSLVRLTRDVTNHPIWNSAAVWARGVGVDGNDGEEEELAKGGLGRFKRRFGGAMGLQVDWMEESGGSSKSDGHKN